MHVTKDKADIATSKVISSLLDQGFNPLLPFSDHLKYDLVAEKDGTFWKLQVKYLGKDQLPKRGYWLKIPS